MRLSNDVRAVRRLQRESFNLLAKSTLKAQNTALLNKQALLLDTQLRAAEKRQNTSFRQYSKAATVLLRSPW